MSCIHVPARTGLFGMFYPNLWLKFTYSIMWNVQWPIIRDAGDYRFPYKISDRLRPLMLSFCLSWSWSWSSLLQCDEHGQVRERPQGDSKPRDPEGEAADLLLITVSSCSVDDNRCAGLCSLFSFSLSSGPAGAGRTGGTEAGSL